MKRCKRCVQTDSRPEVYFNEEGVCGACLYEDERATIDWDKRKIELLKIVKEAKKQAMKNKCAYDCVIGVSGGKDSTYQALYAKRLGLRTLLVSCEPEGQTDIGKKNIENLKQLGFDCITIRPNPQIMKQLIMKDFYECLNPVKVTEFPLWASAYIIADKFNIPLIIQGENDALNMGLKKSKMGLKDDALKINKHNTLATGIQRYVSRDVSPKDLFLYTYDEKSMRKKGIRAIWLNYYDKYWSQIGNPEEAIMFGLTIRKDSLKNLGRLHKWSALDCNLHIVNQMIKYKKFGFGFATDEACYDIREGYITREKALKLVKKYDGKCADKYVQEFCDYIGITKKEFWRVVNNIKRVK